MLYSTDRILTTHAGSLPRPPDLRDMVLAKANGAPYDRAAFDTRLKSAVAEVVLGQVQSGIDCVNDGELSKTNFTDYVRWRIAGYEARPSSGARRLSITARDETEIRRLFRRQPTQQTNRPSNDAVCVSELRYVGQAELAKDLDNFTAALGRRQRGRRLLAGQHAGHHRTLDAERILPRATRRSCSPSPMRCMRNTRRSSMPASCCRSTIRTCPTAGTACPTSPCQNTANTPRCGLTPSITP